MHGCNKALQQQVDSTTQSCESRAATESCAPDCPLHYAGSRLSLIAQVSPPICLERCTVKLLQALLTSLQVRRELRRLQQLSQRGRSTRGPTSSIAK